MALYSTSRYWGGTFSVAYVSANFIWALCVVETLTMLYQIIKLVRGRLNPSWMVGVHGTWTAGWFAEVCIFFVTDGQFALLFHQGNFSGLSYFASWNARQWLVAGAAAEVLCFFWSLYLTVLSLVVLVRRHRQHVKTIDPEADVISVRAKTEGLHEKPDSNNLPAKSQNGPMQYPYTPQEMPSSTPRLGSNVLVINGVVYRAVPDGEAQEWRSRELSEMIASTPLDKAIELGTMSMISKSVAAEERQGGDSSSQRQSPTVRESSSTANEIVSPL